MADLPVPPGTVLRVHGSGVPHLYVTPTRRTGGIILQTPQAPVLVRTPGITGPAGPPGGTEVFAFSGTGPEYVRTGQHKVMLERVYEVESVRATVGTAPLGTALIVDVLADGVSIYGNPAYRPSIPPTATNALAGSNSPDMLNPGVMLSVAVVQVGAVRPGSDLAIVIRLHPVG